MEKITLGERALDGKLSLKFIASTITAYNKVAVQLHQAACLAFYRAAQFGDPDSLNAFYNGLRVNDQTALRVWIGKHATYVDLDNGEVRPWIKWSKDKGFAMIKGRQEHRQDVFTLDSEEDGKQMLLALEPFFQKNVKDKDAIDLVALISMLKKTAERVEKKSKDENIPLPADILSLITSTKNATSKELEALERVKE